MFNSQVLESIVAMTSKERTHEKATTKQGRRQRIGISA